MSILINGLFDPFRCPFYETDEPQIDWKETEQSHVIEVELPGIRKEDVKLEVRDGSVMHISAERKEEAAEEKQMGEKWHCRERRVGASLSRCFRLPEDAKVEEIKASMKDGLLIVTVAKGEREKKGVEIEGDDSAHHAPPRRLGRFLCCRA